MAGGVGIGRIWRFGRDGGMDEIDGMDGGLWGEDWADWGDWTDRVWGVLSGRGVLVGVYWVLCQAGMRCPFGARG